MTTGGYDRPAGEHHFKKGEIMGKRIAVPLIAVVLVVTFAGSALALLPPWWIAYRSLCYSVGMSPGVEVREPEDVGGEYVVRVVVEADNLLRFALDSLLADEIYATRIEVVDEAGVVGPSIDDVAFTVTPAFVRVLLYVAFYRNLYFDSASIGPFATAYLVTANRTIQFFTDDISEAFSRNTYVAEDLFDIVLKDTVGDVWISCSSQYEESPSCE